MSTLPMNQGAVPLGGPATAVAAGQYHSVVLLVDGSMRAFGHGSDGRLGYGASGNVGDKPSTLPSLQGGVNLGGEAVAVAAGTSHTLVAMADGKLFAFGYGADGRLGSGSTDIIGNTPQTLPLSMGPVSLGGNAVAVAAGGAHSLVLLEDGSVLAFGAGGQGRLGYGSTSNVGDTPQTVPSAQGAVPLGGNAVAVAAGGAHSLVLLEDGSVLAFGAGGQGRLGYGSTSNVGDKPQTVPSAQGAVPLGGNAVVVAAGSFHSLVVLNDGSVLAFGEGITGSLGYGSISNVGDTPQTAPSAQDPVPLGGKAVAVAAAPMHSLVMLEDGTARAFGNGGYGKLGYGDSSNVGDKPETLPSKKGPVPLVAPSPTPSPSPTQSPSATPSSSVTASPSPTLTTSPTPTASPTASGAATGNIGTSDDGAQPADDGGVSAFVVVGAVAGAALLLGGAAWAMKQVGLGRRSGRSAPSAAGPASAGAAAVQQAGSGEALAVGGASGLSSIGVQSPASGSRV
ncbi:hypothetical protein FNF29_07986 [Cafeteria roenbergensis]|uniref:Uncharacterized protein n=1 Tax=Cafeteria roenbergensis TaxID=33653 RepID=A0A5A8C127_CAFRO|nr:hypothetical protein FNF29_07986 [Cafeteria roenbergensis]|eukprot:KAA0146514.1 hypothetical protein FNF29_07986 [Cafeteria roenbergensis]